MTCRVVCGRNTVLGHSSQVVPGVSGTPETGRMQLEVGHPVSLKRTCAPHGSVSALCKHGSPRCSAMVKARHSENESLRKTWEHLWSFWATRTKSHKNKWQSWQGPERSLQGRRPELVTLEGGKVEKELELVEEEEEESEDGEEVEVSGDDGPDWRRTAWSETVVESTGTVTRKAEEKGMSKVAEVGNVVSEVSVAVASVSEQTDFPRFAKRAKTRDFAQLSSEVPAMSKLQSSQLDQRGHAGSKIQYAQPISVEKSSSSKTRPVLAKVKRERTGRVPGIIETKPRMQRQTSRPEPSVLPLGYLVANGHKLRCLHYVGRCWRKPERDIKNWQYFGQIQPAPSECDHYCRHCWSKGLLPGGSSEPACTADDSGSSSTDA